MNETALFTAALNEIITTAPQLLPLLWIVYRLERMLKASNEMLHRFCKPCLELIETPAPQGEDSTPPTPKP